MCHFLVKKVTKKAIKMDKRVRLKIYRADLIHSQCPIVVDPLTNKSMRMAEVYSSNFLVYPTNFL